MSSDMNWSGSFKRALKGDLDPANIFGFGPSRKDLRDNKYAREALAKQIKFENSDIVAASGGSTEAATKQIPKLDSSAISIKNVGKQALRNPLTTAGGFLVGGPIGAAATATALAAKKNKKDNKGRANAPQSEPISPIVNSDRLSRNRIRQSILGRTR